MLDFFSFIFTDFFFKVSNSGAGERIPLQPLSDAQVKDILFFNFEKYGDVGPTLPVTIFSDTSS